MNKIFTFLFLTISSFCFSQNFNAGTIIGINTSQVSFDNLSGFNKIGMRIGAFVNKQFGEFDGQLELLYINKGSRQGINSETYSEGYRLHLNYIEIPLSVKKDLYKNIDFEIGGSISYLLNWLEKYDGIENYGFDMNKLEYSIHIGIEYPIQNNLYLNTRLSNSILPIRSHSSDQIYKWYHGQYNTSISFVLYYYFIKK
jgi:hypothetical protein